MPPPSTHLLPMRRAPARPLRQHPALPRNPTPHILPHAACRPGACRHAGPPQRAARSPWRAPAGVGRVGGSHRPSVCQPLPSGAQRRGRAGGCCQGSHWCPDGCAAHPCAPPLAGHSPACPVVALRVAAGLRREAWGAGSSSGMLAANCSCRRGRTLPGAIPASRQLPMPGTARSHSTTTDAAASAQLPGTSHRCGTLCHAHYCAGTVPLPRLAASWRALPVLWFVSPEERPRSTAPLPCQCPTPANARPQMVWRDTTKLGCGYSFSCGMKTWVCNYSPPGNVVGQDWSQLVPPPQN
jgi:hypothetical protein